MTLTTRRRSLAPSLALLLLLMVAGSACVGTLLKETTRATDAVDFAREAGAKQYASELYQEAIASLDEAKRLGQTGEAKELLMRARLQAEVAAELAGERALAEQLRSAREVLENAKAEADEAHRMAEQAKNRFSQSPSDQPLPPEPLAEPLDVP